LLKEYYTRDAVETLSYTDHPLWAMMGKKSDFFGDIYKIPMIYGTQNGRGRTVALAQSASGVSKSAAFELRRAKDYAVVQLDNEAIDATSNSAGSFVELMTMEMDSAWASISRAMSSELYRDGTGSLATAASVNTNTVTLTNAADIVHFEVGMPVEFNDVSVTPDVVYRAGTYSNGVISAVDRSAGKFTIPSIADYAGYTLGAGDMVAVYGDMSIDGVTNVPALTKIAGLSAWIPSSAPSSTSFFGVDRSLDTSRLGGQRYDGSSEPIEEALINGLTLIAREGGRPDKVFVSYERFADLEKALGAKREYSEQRVTAEVAFPGMLIHSPAGPVRIVPDQDCQADTAWALQMNTWSFVSLYEAPRILDQDGLEKLRLGNDDAVEFRIGYYGNLGCKAPGYNGRITLPT
jgi:hypothetical protein